MKKYQLILLSLLIFQCQMGEETIYYPNGALKEIKSYSNGLRDGKWISFNVDGDTSRIKFYKSDSLKWQKILFNNQVAVYQEFKDSTTQHGKEIFYHPNRQIETISLYRDGMPHGKTFGYFSDGSVKTKMIYERGIAKELEQYYPNGNLFISSDNYSAGIITYHDSSGVKKLKILMKGGKAIDTLKVY